MNYLTSLWCCSLLLALPACADEVVMTRVLHQRPALEQLQVCHGGGCAEVSTVSLTAQEWQQVQAHFLPPPLDGAEERYSIAQALGEMEAVIGVKTGTSGDRAGTFGNSAFPGQLDCNDEAINSTNYLKLLQQAGLLHFHRIADIKRRGYFIHGWPHSSAAIEDLASGELYAVDSWFHDNGQPAEVIPLAQWKSGWKPADSAAR